jgi:hypothetical protein
MQQLRFHHGLDGTARFEEEAVELGVSLVEHSLRAILNDH